MNERDQTIDLVKGLGIILVVLGHSKIEFGHYMIYMFHMPLFFFVSGMLHKPRGLKELATKKAGKTGKVYVIYFILCTLVDIALRGNDALAEINPFYPQGSAGPLWFMISLFEANLCFALVQRYAKKRSLAVCFALSLIGYFLHRINTHLYCFLDSTLSVMVFYGLGYALKEKRGKRLLLHAPLYVSAPVFVLMYVLDYKLCHLGCNDIWSNTVTGNFALYVLSALAGISLVYSAANRLNLWLNKIRGGISVIGHHSLYVFAMHLPILNILHCLYPAPTDCMRLVYVVVAILMSYYVGMLLHRLRLV